MAMKTTSSPPRMPLLAALALALLAAAGATAQTIGKFAGPDACYKFDAVGNPVMVRGVASIAAGPSAAVVARHWLDANEQQGLAVEVASLASGLSRSLFNATAAAVVSVDWQRGRIVTVESGAAKVRSLSSGNVLQTYGYPGGCAGHRDTPLQTLASHAARSDRHPLGYALVYGCGSTDWAVGVSSDGSVRLGVVPPRPGVVPTHLSVAWDGGYANVAERVKNSPDLQVSTMTPITGGGGTVSTWAVPDPTGSGVQRAVPVCNSGKCEALLSSYSGEFMEQTFLADVDGMASKGAIFSGREDVLASLFVSEDTILVLTNASVRRCRLYNIAPPTGGRPTADCAFVSSPPGAPTAIDAFRPANGSSPIVWVASSKAVRGTCGSTSLAAYHV